MSTFRIKSDGPVRVQARINKEVTVSYDRQFNMIEVAEGGKVLLCQIVPDHYTLRSFLNYLGKIQAAYDRPSVKL